MRLQPVDRVILRELLRWEGNHPEGTVRFPALGIARRTGVHVNTVRARLALLKKGGVVEGARFEPWPRLVGLTKSGWFFQGMRPGDARETRDLLAKFPSASMGVFGLDWLFIHFWEESDAGAAANAKAVAKTLEAESFERHFTSTEFPPSPADSLDLSPLDRKLMVALRGQASSLASLARNLHVTPRTVERRAERLFAAGAGGMFPILRPAAIEGEILVHYLLKRGDERAISSLANAFPDRLFGPWGRGVNTGVGVTVANLDRAAKLRAEAERLPGVIELDLHLYRDAAYNPAFEPYLADRLHASPRSREDAPRARASPTARR